MELQHIIETAGRYMDLAGVAIMVVGAVVSIPLALRGFQPKGLPAGPSRCPSTAPTGNSWAGRFCSGWNCWWRPTSSAPSRSPPPIESVGVLAIIVLIRTFLSFSLELEITGRWPWQKEPEGSSAASPAG